MLFNKHYWQIFNCCHKWYSDEHLCMYFCIYKSEGSCVIDSQDWWLVKDEVRREFWQSPICPQMSVSFYAPARMCMCPRRPTLVTRDPVILVSIDSSRRQSCPMAESPHSGVIPKFKSWFHHSLVLCPLTSLLTSLSLLTREMGLTRVSTALDCQRD